VFEGVSATDIRSFVRSYRFHPDARSLSPDTIDGYIDSQLANGLLREWSVVFAGAAGGRRYELVDGMELELNQRSKLVASDSETARLGVISSASDLMADLPDAPSDRVNIDEIIRMRAGVPILVIYVIDRDSPARAGSRTRAPLDAVDHLVGMAVLFPEGLGASAQSYKTADLSGFAREALEYEPEHDDADVDKPAA
jgi:hypothetical protein